MQTACRAHPDVVLAIFQKRLDRVAGQTGSHRGLLDPKVRGLPGFAFLVAVLRGSHTPKPLTECCNPQIAVPVVHQSVSAALQRARRRAWLTEPSEACNDVGDPDGAFGVLTDPPHEPWRHSLERICLTDSSEQPAACGSNPQFTFTADERMLNKGLAPVIQQIDLGPVSVLHSVQGVVTYGPYGPAMILDEISDRSQ